jgi:hypothetical protein
MIEDSIEKGRAARVPNASRQASLLIEKLVKLAGSIEFVSHICSEQESSQFAGIDALIVPARSCG